MLIDSGLCVLKLILEMSKRGFYWGVLIKKGQYFPRGFHEYGINK